MKYVLVLTTFLLCWKYHHTVPVLKELEASSLSKKLNELSKLGEDYLGQEIEKALLGVKQMKEIIEKNAEQHENIQKSLKKTQEEKEEAVRLFQDISEKLREAEMCCTQMLRPHVNGCQACFQRSCITSYSNSCSQQESQEFVIKACEFIKEWSPLSLNINTTEEKSVGGYNVAAELSQADGMFSQLMSDVGIMFNQSIVFFTSFQKMIGDSFQKFFLSEVKQRDATTAAPDRDPVIIADHDEHWDFSSLFQSLYEFGKSVFEAMSDAVVKIYKKINNNSEDFSILPEEAPAHLKSTPSNIKCSELQNASECWLFQETCQQCYESVRDCPDVKELHLKSKVALKLVNISAEQYEDVVQLAQQHTDDTFHLVNQMKQQFGWLAEHANATSRIGTIFSIEKVSFSPDAEEQNVHDDTVVEVRIFTSPNVEIRLPANINIESQEFIQYVTEKALENYKNNF